MCPLPPMVSHGDFICHPRPCDRYNHGTVVEFYCDPGYSLTSDYKYITCQYGEWFPSYQVYCIKSGERVEHLALPARARLGGHTVAAGCVLGSIPPPPHTVLGSHLCGCTWLMIPGPVQRVRSINLSVPRLKCRPSEQGPHPPSTHGLSSSLCTLSSSNPIPFH